MATRSPNVPSPFIEKRRNQMNKGKPQPNIQLNCKKMTRALNIPEINVEDVTLTDVEQSSDEMSNDDTVPTSKERKSSPKVLEMEGVGLEETVGVAVSKKFAKYNSKNKMALYCISKGSQHLVPNKPLIAELTDTEDILGSDAEIGNVSDDEEECDYMLKYNDGKETIAIKDNFKGVPVPSPAVTPEPLKQGLRRRKPVKLVKDQLNYQENNSKRLPYLTPDFRTELSSTFTDTELLLSNSESEHEIGTSKTKQKSGLAFDGWLTDIEDLAASADKNLKNSTKVKTSNSVNNFFYLCESGSEDEFQVETNKVRNPKHFSSKKFNAKEFSNMGYLNGPFNELNQRKCEKYLCSPQGSVNAKTVEKKFSDSKKNVKDVKKNYSVLGSNYDYLSEIINSQTQMKSLKNGEKIKISRQSSACEQLSKTKRSKSSPFYFEENNSTEIESFDSEGEDNICYNVKKHSKNEAHSFQKKYSEKLSRSQGDGRYSSRNISPAISLPEDSVISFNENLKEKNRLSTINNIKDPLTDTEDIFLPSVNKKKEVKKKVDHSLHVMSKLKSRLTDTEDIEVSDNEISQNLPSSQKLYLVDNIVDPLTDTEDIFLTSVRKKKELKKNPVNTLLVMSVGKGLTDTEDLELSDNETFQQSVGPAIIGHHMQEQILTDTEEFSVLEDTDEELYPQITPNVITPEHFRYIRNNTITTEKEGPNPYVASEIENNFYSDQDIPIIHTISPSPTFQPTDTEDMVASDEETFSRNETPNVSYTKAYEDHFSVVHMKNTRKFKIEGEETLHVKGNSDTQEPTTDVEDIYTHDEGGQKKGKKDIYTNKEHHFSSETNEIARKKSKQGGQNESDILSNSSKTEPSKKRGGLNKSEVTSQDKFGKGEQEGEEHGTEAKPRDSGSQQKGSRALQDRQEI